MRTLVVYYSKTGTTAKVAQEIIKKANCDSDELQFDESSKTIGNKRNPSEYERVILLAPVWAFSLAEPMKLYVAKYGADIKRYDLIVTCGGLGLRGCIRNCVSAIGKPPVKALKLRSKIVKLGNFDISEVL